MGKLIQLNKNVLESYIQAGYNSRKVCELLHIGKSTLFKNLKQFGLSFSDHKWFDIYKFDTIDSEEKAYWLGFLFADGYVCGYHNQLEVSLKSDDIDHLLKFKTFLEDKRDDSIIKISKVNLNDKQFERCRYIVGDKHFHEELINKGCIPNKSLILKFPDINIFKSEELVFDFIRGYIDGDGCLTISRGRPYIYVDGSKDFLTGLMDFIPEFKIVPNRNKNHCTIRANTKESLEIYKKLYSNSTIYLDRKYNKFAPFCKEREQGNNGKS